jgi:rhodanese-related sulfurtransferase
MRLRATASRFERMIQQLTPRDLKRRLDDETRPQPVLLDVREAWEFSLCRLEGAQHIPMRTVPLRLGELDRNAELVVICHHGARSYQIAMFLDRQGFGNLYNLYGGVAGWARDVDPTMPTY